MTKLHDPNGLRWRVTHTIIGGRCDTNHCIAQALLLDGIYSDGSGNWNTRACVGKPELYWSSRLRAAVAYCLLNGLPVTSGVTP